MHTYVYVYVYVYMYMYTCRIQHIDYIYIYPKGPASNSMIFGRVALSLTGKSDRRRSMVAVLFSTGHILSQVGFEHVITTKS